GLDPQIQSTTALRVERGRIAAGSINNILARIPGSANTRPLMLAAHYDSVPTGPGASDDASGVSTILETVRALKTGPQLKNDLIVLITDSEEEGLLGASAFVAEHPWAKEVGVAMNFEARGAGGPSFMFETSNENGWLINEFAKAAPYPAANSLTYALYSLLPNDTDMTEFKRIGLSGLNFACVGNWNRYHTMLDTPGNLDPRFLQQDGSYALSLAKELGNVDLSNTKQPDDAYFEVIGPVFIRYPLALSITIAIAVAAAFFAMLLMGRRREVLRWGGMGLGVIAVPVTCVAAWAAATGLWWAVKKIRPDYNKAPWGDPYNGTTYLLAMFLVTIAISSLIYGWCFKRTNIQSLAVGALSWGVFASLVSALYLPGGSFLFEWPVMFAVIGLIFLIVREGRGGSAIPVIVIFSIPLILLGVPILYSLFLLVSLNGIGLLMVVAAAGLVPLVPHLGFIMSGFRTWAPAVAALAVVVIVIGLVTGKPGPNTRMVDDVFYDLNTDNGQARWVSIDSKPDEWTSQFFGQSPERRPLREFVLWADLNSISSPAPALPLSPPQLRVTSDVSANGVRKLDLHISSAREAPGMMVSMPSSLGVSNVLVNGKPIPAAFEKGGPDRGSSNWPWNLVYTSVPKDGFDLSFEVNSGNGSKVAITLYDFIFALPQIPNEQLTPRPDYLMVAPYFGVSDTTVVSKVYDLPPGP
ncbi:MAG TPA: M20/M25/M40 family metallo-hydrolase, partial [Blastocatellia bacterium]